MPTLGEACYQLRVSRRTLDKWLTRCDITPERHPLDWRFFTISDEDIEKIRQTRAQMPGQNAAPRFTGLPAFRAPRSVRPSTPKPPESHYSASNVKLPNDLTGFAREKQISASQEDLASRPLPAGWIARSTWCKRHGLNDRSVIRQAQMPATESAPDGRPWGNFAPASHIYQAVYEAYRVDQLTECARVAQVVWQRRWHTCEDLECPCH